MMSYVSSLVSRICDNTHVVHGWNAFPLGQEPASPAFQRANHDERPGDSLTNDSHNVHLNWEGCCAAQSDHFLV